MLSFWKGGFSLIFRLFVQSLKCPCSNLQKNIDLIVEEKDKKVIISVKDYGTGLPKEVQEKLFKEMVTTKGKNGTGLGLFMSYSTIRAHFNGNITFDTKEDEGTSFHIILPKTN